MGEAKVLTLNDLKALQDFERQHLATKEISEIDRELLSWHASWRNESLEHYLPLGWSFGVWQGDSLRGYFLAQPQLFLRAMTQTLWIERLVAHSPAETAELFEIAYRMAREKHFQKILIHSDGEWDQSQLIFQLQPLNNSIFEINTAKI